MVRLDDMYMVNSKYYNIVEWIIIDEDSELGKQLKWLWADNDYF